MLQQIIKTAAGYLVWMKSLGSEPSGPERDAIKATFKALPRSERYHVQRDGVEAYFTDDNKKEGSEKEHVSPSGRYKLVVSAYGTKPGSWNYTRGEVFRTVDGEKVGDVMRNYSSFPFLWLENHVDGHDYLVCGEDYQGQTFCQLDTGERRSLIPDDAFEGFGFCWADCELLSDGKTLRVSGCYWAAPYEIRFFDVSDPMQGWPAIMLWDEEDEKDYPLSLEDEEENTRARFEDGKLIWEKGVRILKETGEREIDIDSQYGKLLSDAYKAKHLKAPPEEVAELEAKARAYLDSFEWDDEEAQDANWYFSVEHRIVYQLAGLKAEVLEEWKSDWALERERQYEEANAARKSRAAKWREEDALLQHLKSEVGKVSAGFMYPSQVSRWDGEKNPAFFQVRARAFDMAKSYNHTATLQWGVLEGPVTLELYVRGKGNFKSDPPEFPRTPEGVMQAWECAWEHLRAEKGVA